jgi:DNA-binding GntR family transcriptional regulator
MTTINKTANSVVYETLRQQILEGLIFPGAWLREQDLVEQFNVSRTPIREALRRLESEELIEVVPYRGARVRSLSPEDFREEYTVRAALEGFAIELAVSRISDEKIEQLQKISDQMDALLDKENLKAFLEVNRQFHMMLYEESGSNRLVSLIASSWDKENLYRLVFLSQPAALEIEKAIHHNMLEACRLRDGKRARKITQDGLMKAATLMQKWYEPDLQE